MSLETSGLEWGESNRRGSHSRCDFSAASSWPLCDAGSWTGWISSHQIQQGSFVGLCEPWLLGVEPP